MRNQANGSDDPVDLSNGANYHGDDLFFRNGNEKRSMKERDIMINGGNMPTRTTSRNTSPVERMSDFNLEQWETPFESQNRSHGSQIHAKKEHLHNHMNGHLDVPAPSSLMAFNTRGAPRKITSRLGVSSGVTGKTRMHVHHPNNEFPSNENMSPNISPTERNNTFREDHNNSYENSDAADSSFGPFRDRFASAAMVSQVTNASMNSSFEQQHLPSNEYLNMSDDQMNMGTAISSSHDENYVSFGNQSVFSDITGGESYIETSPSEGSNSPSMASKKSISSSASRDMRRKARLSKNTRVGRNGHGHQRHHSQIGPLHQVEEEDDFVGEISVPQVARKSTSQDYGNAKIGGMENHEKIISPNIEHEANHQNQRGKKLSARLASFFANRSQSRASPTNINNGDVVRSSTDFDRRPKSQPRSKSHFRTRSSPNESNDLDGLHDHEHSNGLVGRSVSVPRERLISQRRTMTSSPTRSHVSGAESSVGPKSIRWPGTLDKNGQTIVQTPSFNENSDDESSDIRSSMNDSKQINSKGSYRDEGKTDSRAEDMRSTSTPGVVKDGNRGHQFVPKPSLDEELNISSVGGNNGKGNSRSPFLESAVEELQNPNHVVASRVRSRSNRIADIRKQFEKDRPQIVDLDKKPPPNVLPLEPRPADYHLAAALNRVKASKRSNSQNKDKQNRSMEIDRSYEVEDQNLNHSFPGAGGSGRNSFDRSSPLPLEGNDTNAYTTHTRVNQNVSLEIERSFEVVEQDLNHSFPGAKTGSSRRSVRDSHPKIDTSASLRRVQSAGRGIPGLRHNTTLHKSNDQVAPHSPKFRLSEAALRENDRVSPKLQTFAHGANVKGYRGFIDKTAEVPNLIDDVESITSASTMATERKPGYKDTESDVFDGLSCGSVRSHIHYGGQTRVHQPLSPTFERLREKYTKRNSSDESSSDQAKVVKMNNAMFSIQATRDDVNRRKTAADFDAALTDSDTDHLPRLRRSPRSILPGHYDPIKPRKPLPPISDDESSYDSCGGNASDNDSETLSVLHDLSKYAVAPLQVRRLVRAYRQLSDRDPSEAEGAKKAFALFEMRSRIMVSDIERGFERAGGTITVDDLVLTSFYKAACRVRDAVIVSKAWRDGASPQDARTASNLTKGFHYHIKRDFPKTNSIPMPHMKSQIEQLTWIDDTEFSLIRCFGSRTLRGTDIFTTGDCQSLLLKLTHENCEQIRREHKDAISRQLIAEKLMNNDGGGHTSTMTEAELEYLSSMEDAETITRRLCQAEKAFDMVKDQIEGLVKKYEGILEQIDNQSRSASSYDSNAGDDESVSSVDFDDRKDNMARRVQRAELQAEAASREAQIAKTEAEKSKQEAERIRMQKENELRDLRQKFEELETKSSIMQSDFEAKLKSQVILNNSKKRVKFGQENPLEAATSPESMLYAASSVGADPDQNETKARIKARFRERRKISNVDDTKEEARPTLETNKSKLSGRVHQRLQFYERSLQSINQKDISTRTL